MHTPGAEKLAAMAVDENQRKRLTAAIGEKDANATLANWAKHAEILAAQDIVKEAKKKLADSKSTNSVDLASLTNDVKEAETKLAETDDLPELQETQGELNSELAHLDALDDQALAMFALIENNGEFNNLTTKVDELKSERDSHKEAIQEKLDPIDNQISSRPTSELRALEWKPLWTKPAIFAGAVMILFIILFREDKEGKTEHKD